MTVEQAKSCIWKLVSQYFAGASVIWSGQNIVKPVKPLVMLRLSNVQRSDFSIPQEEDGTLVKLYPTVALLTVNLFTLGKPTRAGTGKVATRINTALHDLSSFVNFLDSEYALAYMEEQNLQIMPQGATQDISELLDNTQYEYRAVQEFTIEFIQEVHGWAGVRTGEDFQPTDSGGGTKELADLITGWTDDVEIEGRNANE